MSFSPRRFAATLPSLSSKAVRGVTLFEALITVLLMSSAIAWALQANVTALRAAANSYTGLLVVKGVQEYYLEYTRSQPFASLQPNDTGFSFTTPATNPGGGLTAQRVWCYTQLENNDPQLKRVTIEVGWTDPDGRPRSSTVSTLISEGGLTN